MFDARITIPLTLVALMLTGMMPSPCQARDWYVSADAGGSSGGGRGGDGSADAPFRTVQAGVEAAMPGDRVVVQPGRYPEEVTLRRSGTADAPIVLIAEPARGALLDGSQPLTGWERCPSAEGYADSPHHENLYVTYLPEGVSEVSANLYENEQLLYLSQTPAPRDAFYYDDRESLRETPVEGYTSTTIVDPAFFNQPDPAYWDGALMMIWTGNNAIITREVERYEPATGLIGFADVKTSIKPGKDGYAVRNHPALIDAPGEYAVSKPDGQGRRTVWLWPTDPANLESGISVSVRRFGVDLNAQSHVRVEGLRIRRYSGGLGDYTGGIGIVNAGFKPAGHAVIRNNEVLQCKAGSNRWVVQALGYSDTLVEANHVHHNQRNRGIGVTGSKSQHVRNVVIRDNLIERCGGTGINFYWAEDSKIVGNTVRDNRGNHANAITVYLHSRRILIDGNRAIRSNMGITVQESSDITITNNLVVGQDGWDGRLITLYGPGENITVLNNTVLNTSKHNAIGVPANATNYVLKNNIADGIALPSEPPPGPIVLSNNLFTDLTWNMKPEDLGGGSLVENDLGNIFSDPEAGDYTLRAGSPAIDAGADVSGVVDHDLAGTPRPQGEAFDIGAYEFAP